MTYRSATQTIAVLCSDWPVFPEQDIVGQLEVVLHYPGHEGAHTREQSQPIPQIQAWKYCIYVWIESSSNHFYHRVSFVAVQSSSHSKYCMYTLWSPYQSEILDHGHGFSIFYFHSLFEFELNIFCKICKTTFCPWMDRSICSSRSGIWSTLSLSLSVLTWNSNFTLGDTSSFMCCFLAKNVYNSMTNFKIALSKHFVSYLYIHVAFSTDPCRSVRCFW